VAAAAAEAVSVAVALAGLMAVVETGQEGELEALEEEGERAVAAASVVVTGTGRRLRSCLQSRSCAQLLRHA